MIRSSTLSRISPLQIWQPSLMALAKRLPMFGSPVPAGFPSPADDYIEGRLSLDEHLIQHKDATFFVRAKGNSMIEAGISDGSILVVDKSLKPAIGDIVVAVVEGDFTVKYLGKRGDSVVLKPANARYKEIEFKDGQELEIWGVVTSTVKKFR